MPDYDRLRGLVGQNMTGRRIALPPYATNFGPGAWTFTAPDAGYYKFVLWGPGGGGGASGAGDTVGGASGAYAEYTALMGRAETASIAVGLGGTTRLGGGTTIVTLAGRTVTCTGGGPSAGSTAAGGVASGGDLNINGTDGSTATANAGSGTGGGAGGTGAAAGAGAPANAPFRGAVGQNTGAGATPGPGAGGALTGAGIIPSGGPGQVIVTRVDAPYTPGR